MSALKRLAVLTLVIAAAARLLAAPVTVKLATQAPANTTWHKALTDMWWDPDDSDRLIIGSDGGVQFSNDGGRTTDYAPNLRVGEVYAIGVDMKSTPASESARSGSVRSAPYMSAWPRGSNITARRSASCFARAHARRSSIVAPFGAGHPSVINLSGSPAV